MCPSETRDLRFYRPTGFFSKRPLVTGCWCFTTRSCWDGWNVLKEGVALHLQVPPQKVLRPSWHPPQTPSQQVLGGPGLVKGAPQCVGVERESP